METKGRAACIIRLSIILAVRLALSFALTFGLACLARLAWCMARGRAFDARWTLAVTCWAWIALRCLNVMRLAMPHEYGRRKWYVVALDWLAMVGFVLSALGFLHCIFD